MFLTEKVRPLHTDSTSVGLWERFVLIPQPDGSVEIAMFPLNNPFNVHFLTAVRGGGIGLSGWIPEINGRFTPTQALPANGRCSPSFASETGNFAANSYSLSSAGGNDAACRRSGCPFRTCTR